MRSLSLPLALMCVFVNASLANAEITPATFDLPAVRDTSALETRVVQDWKPAPKDPSIRQDRRVNERITLEQARAAGWSDAEITAMNDRAWDVCRTTSYLPVLKKRGLEMFYNVGANDSVSPDLLELGQRFPEFPIYIVPGGQHGGPKDSGFTRQVPSQPEVEDNLFTFAQHHFFSASPMIAAPKVATKWDAKSRTLRVTVTFPDGTEPQKNELSWSVNRHAPYTLAFEYDAWTSAPLQRAGAGKFSGEIKLDSEARTVELLTTHTAKNLPLSISSPLLRVETK